MKFCKNQKTIIWKKSKKVKKSHQNVSYLPEKHAKSKWHETKIRKKSHQNVSYLAEKHAKSKWYETKIQKNASRKMKPFS